MSQGRHRTKRAIGWAFGQSWGHHITNSVALVLMAAILGPRDFGIMALGMAYLEFVQMIVAQGFVAALIQKKTLKTAHVACVFWILLGISLVLTAVTVFVADHWAAINHAPSLGPVLITLSFSIPFTALSRVPEALLRRHMDFRALALRNLVAAIVSAPVGVICALSGAGVWALVVQHMVWVVVSTVMLWSATYWRPRLVFSWSAARSILGFSFASFAARIGVYLSSQADIIVLGILWGPVVVGLYRFAEKIVGTGLELLSGPLNAVSFPQLSRVQESPIAFRTAVFSYLRFASVLTWPAMAVVAATSVNLVAILGGRWDDAAPVLSVMAGCAAIQTLTGFLAPILQSVGRPGMLAGFVWCRGVLGLAAFTAIGHYVAGLDVVTQTCSIALTKAAIDLAIPFSAFLLILKRVAAISTSELMKALLPSGAFALVGFALPKMMLLLFSGSEELWPHAQTMIVLIITGGVLLVGLIKYSPEFHETFDSLISVPLRAISRRV